MRNTRENDKENNTGGDRNTEMLYFGISEELKREWSCLWNQETAGSGLCLWSAAVLPGVETMMSVCDVCVCLCVCVCVWGRSVSLSGGPGPLWG